MSESTPPDQRPVDFKQNLQMIQWHTFFDGKIYIYISLQSNEANYNHLNAMSGSNYHAFHLSTWGTKWQSDQKLAGKEAGHRAKSGTL